MKKILYFLLIFLPFQVVSAWGNDALVGCAVDGFEAETSCPPYIIATVASNISESPKVVAREENERYILLQNAYFLDEKSHINFKKPIKGNIFFPEGFKNFWDFKKWDTVIFSGNFPATHTLSSASEFREQIEEEKKYQEIINTYFQNSLHTKEKFYPMASVGTYYRVSCNEDKLILTNKNDSYTIDGFSVENFIHHHSCQDIFPKQPVFQKVIEYLKKFFQK